MRTDRAEPSTPSAGLLAPEVDQALREIGPVDIVVGIPTHNNAATIGPVLEAVRLGLAKHFPDGRAAVVSSDGGSTDGTPELIAGFEGDVPRVLARHDAPAVERIAVPYHGIPGRGDAQHTILEAAHRLGARACALVGADALTVSPEWTERLVRPVLEDGYDYVAPRYQRSRYDGTLTQVLVYPLVRALYGKRVRQPVGGQGGLSGRLVAHLCAQEEWASEFAHHGVDLWTLACVAAERFAICESWLGPSRSDTRGRTTDLATTLVQVAGPTFALLEPTAEVWVDIRGSEPVPLMGTPSQPGVEPVELNVPRMTHAVRLGVKDLLPLWEQILAPDTLSELLALAPLGDEGLRVPHELWARVVYDFALGYHFGVVYRDHLLRSLVPLYLGRTAAFIRDTLAGGAGETEAWIEQSCRGFEAEKPYLRARWQ